MSDEDKAFLADTHYMIYQYRSNLRINRINLSTKFSSVFQFRTIFSWIELGSKALKVHNSDIVFEGAFMTSYQYMSSEFENCTVDLHKVQGGYNNEPTWLETSVPEPTYMRFINVQFYFSEGKIYFWFSSQLL